MLSKEDNEILTRVGPGTLMGNLLRRYWTPALLAEELPAAGAAPIRVRLLGEDLVAFVDDQGKLGLVAENCPHRGASLYFGRNEDCSLRCVYHGWAFDTEGNCTDMPSEPRPFGDRIKLTAYPTHVSGGIVWAYLGPKETITPFRDFGTDDLADDEAAATKAFTPCNWVQAMEGNIDTAHISHLHQWSGIDDIPDDGSDQPGYPSNAMSWKFWRHDRAPRLEVQDTWYGYKYAGVRTTPNQNTHVRITAYIAPYSTLVASIPWNQRHGMFVPVDDTNTARYSFATKVPENIHHYGGANLFAPAPFSTPFSRGLKPTGVTPRDFNAENEYQIDREIQKTSTFSGVGDFVSQDYMVTESMGPIYDRSKEHLGSTDASIIRMRNILLNAARGLAEGQEPPALTGDFVSVRAAEKILAPGEDWRVLGTDDDPAVQEGLGELLAD